MKGRFGSYSIFRSQSSKDDGKKKRDSLGSISSIQDDSVAPTRPQRLTKPRTNTNSHFTGVARNDSGSNKSVPSKPSSRATSRHAEDRQPEVVESRLSFSQEPSLNLPTPTHSPAPDHVYPDNSTSALAIASVPLHSRPSLSHRHSTTVNASDMDIGEAIALLQQLKKNASPEDLIALHKALLPTRSTDPDVQNTLLDGQESTDMVSPLIRRSSLLPAGLATRISLEAVKRRPSRASSRTEPGRPSSHMLRRHESGTWEQFVQGGFDSLNPRGKRVVSRPGAATPSDLEHTHIGSYQPGSLRITNGAASPEPSLLLNFAEQAQSVDAVSSSPTENNFVTRKNEPDAETLSQTDLTSENAPVVRPCSDLNPRAPTFEMEQPYQAPRQRALDMADEYMAECQIGDGLYMENTPLTVYTPHFGTVEDSAPATDVCDGPEEALKKLNGITEARKSRQVFENPISAASHYAFETAYLQAPRRPSLQAKTDSGYSSDASLNAQTEVDGKGANADRVLKSALASKNKTEHLVTAAFSSGSKDTSRAPDANAVEESFFSRPQLSARHSSPVYSYPTTDLVNGDPSTLVSDTVTPAEESKPAKTQKQYKKLQKTRPSQQQQQQQQPPPTVQSLQSIEDEVVPSVPDTVQVNFSRRLIRKPEMSHLDQTFTSVEETNRNTREILSDSNDKSDESNSEERGRGRRKETSPESSKLEKKKSFLGRLRSRSRGKSQHRISANIEDEPMPAVPKSAPVTQTSIGVPHDAATRLTARQPCNNPRLTSYNHGVVPGNPRPKVSMDDATAAEYARSKSRDIAEQQAIERRARSLSRPRRHISDQDTSTDRTPSQSTSVENSSKKSQSRHKRSASAHPRSIPEATESHEHKETVERPRPFRVGTIKFEGGEAQGRLSPMLEKPRNKRRTQSVSPRVRPNIDIPTSDEVKDSEVPKSASPAISAVVPTPSPVSMHSGWPGRETQARLGRDNRQNTCDKVTSPTDKRRSLKGDATVSTAGRKEFAIERGLSKQYQPDMSMKPSLGHSPAIVVSRYVTPPGAALEAYSNSNDPYAAYHTPNPTAHIPAANDVDRSDSAISTSTIKSTSTYKSAMSYSSYHTASSHVSTNYRAYHPSDAVSMSKMIAPQLQHRRSRSHLGPRRSPMVSIQNPRAAYDRYSGGLEYGWERGVGMNGSAGTRQGADLTAKRKSVQLSESYGVDLSDVPVFLVRSEFP